MAILLDIRISCTDNCTDLVQIVMYFLYRTVYVYIELVPMCEGFILLFLCLV